MQIRTKIDSWTSPELHLAVTGPWKRLEKGCLQNVIDDHEINSICSLKGRFREERKSILYLNIEVCCFNYKFTSEEGIVINNNARICLR